MLRFVHPPWGSRPGHTHLTVPHTLSHVRAHTHAHAEESTGRTYALKRMRKSAVVQCPEHVFCEQVGCGSAWEVAALCLSLF